MPYEHYCDDFIYVFTGHSAKFGSYSVMELKSNRIVDIQLVQVSVTELYNRNMFHVFDYCVCELF